MAKKMEKPKKYSIELEKDLIEFDKQARLFYRDQGRREWIEKTIEEAKVDTKISLVFGGGCGGPVPPPKMKICDPKKKKKKK